VALTTIIEAARAAGGKLVVVDAIDEAAHRVLQATRLPYRYRTINSDWYRS